MTKNFYDANFRKTSTTAAYGTLNLTTAFVYDNVGNLTQVTDPRSKITLNTYDTRNRKLNGLFALVLQSPAYQLH